MDLIELIYKLTENLPSKEQFGLISQMRRAAVSIPSNTCLPAEPVAEVGKQPSRLEYHQRCVNLEGFVLQNLRCATRSAGRSLKVMEDNQPEIIFNFFLLPEDHF